MKKLSLVLALLLSSCYITYTDWSIMDEYCLEWCEIYHDNVRDAVWHGNDEYLKATRCGCFTSPAWLECAHLVPYKEY